MLFDIFIIIVVVIGFAVLLWFVQQQFQQLQNNQTQQKLLEDTVSKVFGMSSVHIAQQSKQILQSERENIQTDLKNKQQSIEKLVEELRREIHDRQQEIRLLEQDRNKSYASIREAIEQHQVITKDLKTTTETLAKVLSNNQQRGEWGEHIIEDLLQSSGLMEGVHYAKQRQLGTSTDRPDISLLLPNKRIVPVDVKFPYSEIQKMATAENKVQRDLHKKQFATDVRTKIKKVSQYIRPEEETLDYAILFVPNEMIFSYINQQFPELISEAMQQRVMIVSPFTFLIVARTVFESYRNFMMETNLRTIVKHIGEFAKEWERFIGEFDKFGDSIDKMNSAYRQIRETRHKQLSQRIQKIEQFEEDQTISKLIQ